MTEEQFESCMIQVKNGEKDGLKEIYQAYLTFIYAIIFDVLKNKENTEDVTSEFFIKLLNQADRYRPGNGHKGWLATIARNMAIDYLRKYKKETLLYEMPDDMEYQTEQKADSVESTVVEQMTIEQALQLLQDGERQIISMKVLGDLTFKEIADILQFPMGTVTWRYQNAIKKLRRCGYEQGF